MWKNANWSQQFSILPKPLQTLIIQHFCLEYRQRFVPDLYLRKNFNVFLSNCTRTICRACPCITTCACLEICTGRSSLQIMNIFFLLGITAAGAPVPHLFPSSPNISTCPFSGDSWSSQCRSLLQVYPADLSEEDSIWSLWMFLPSKW